MNKFIEFFKKIFFRKNLLLDEPKVLNEKSSFQEKNFSSYIKINKTDSDLLALQRNLENGLIDEDSLTSEQILKIKDLYYNQFFKLMGSICNYKIKL